MRNGAEAPQGERNKMKEEGKGDSMAPCPEKSGMLGRSTRVMIWVKENLGAGPRGNKDRYDRREVERAVA